MIAPLYICAVYIILSFTVSLALPTSGKTNLHSFDGEGRSKDGRGASFRNDRQVGKIP